MRMGNTADNVQSRFDQFHRKVQFAGRPSENRYRIEGGVYRAQMSF